MGRQVVTDSQAGFGSGLNIVTDQAFLRPDQARQMANYRLSAYGAALKRLGTQITSASPITTFDSVLGVNGGIYWPTEDTIFATGGASASTTNTLWSTTYGIPATWSSLGTCGQYRPVIFTDDVNTEVMYLAGVNTAQVVKVSPAYETITVDQTAAATDTTGVGNISWSHNFGSGSNRLLVVAVEVRSTTVSSVAIDPTGSNLACTKFTAVSNGAGDDVELWYRVAPPTTGSLTIKATFAGTSGNVSAGSITFFGANQTTPFETTSPQSHTTTGGSTATSSVSVLATIGDYIVDAIRLANTNAVTAAGSQTAINDTSGAGMSYLAADASTMTMAWTGTLPALAHVAAAIQRARSSPAYTIAMLDITTPGVSGLCVFNDRLWGWNGYQTPNSLFYSELSSASGSTGGDSLGNASAGGGQIVVRTFGLSEIIACAPVGGSLLIFHDRGISRLTGFGQSDITVAPQALTADVGMANATPDGICVFADIAYFITDRGMYRASESSVEPLSTPDKPDPVAALLQAGTIDPSQCIVRFNRQYSEVWVEIAGIGIYVYNVILGAWSGPFSGTYASATRTIFEVVDSSTGNSHLWRTTYASSAMNVSECDRASTYKDDVTSAGSGGTTVTGTLQLHRFYCADKVFAKTFRWVNLMAIMPIGGTAPTVEFTTPIGGTVTLTMATPTGVESPYYLSPGGQGAFLDMTITDVVSNGLTQYAMATVQANMLGQR